MRRKYLLIGGAGFIGSHFTDSLLGRPEIEGVTLYDNLSSGRRWHFEHHRSDPRFQLVEGDVKNLGALTDAMRGHDTVIHLASNPDIARAATEPEIDFREGTALTNQVLEAMRISGAKQLLYASGSGVYGELGELEAHEDYGPLLPVSTYGASKLAGEAMIAAYSHLFDLRACIFRLGNVVGPRQTHGVGFDFARSLIKDPGRLRVLGDGSQSKSYVHVEDVVAAVMLAHDRACAALSVYNVATRDHVTVREITEIALACLKLCPERVRIEYTGGPKGWKGDVPVVRLNSDRIRSLGWRNARTSREAVRDSILAIVADVEAGRI